jgi:hypothetical protein
VTPGERDPGHSDDHLGPTEDLERAVDGVPHGVVGLTAAFAVMFAVLLVMLFITGGVAGHVAAVVIGILGLPVIVVKLTSRAGELRDHVHPSR